MQWFPGHMAKSIRQIKEQLKIIDLIVVVLDARAPHSSHPSNLKEIINIKKVLYVLNKADLADARVTLNWIKYFKNKNIDCISTNLKEKKDKLLLKNKVLEMFKKYDILTKRVMVLGIPNVGKSTILNVLANKKIVQEQNRPGVTKSLNWIKTSDKINLLDTPGILQPKYDDKDVVINIAILNGIKIELLPIEEVCIKLLQKLKKTYLENLNSYYNISVSSRTLELNLIEKIGQSRGYLNKNNETNLEKTAFNIVKNYADGKLGAISLEEK